MSVKFVKKFAVIDLPLVPAGTGQKYGRLYVGSARQDTRRGGGFSICLSGKHRSRGTLTDGEVMECFRHG